MKGHVGWAFWTTQALGVYLLFAPEIWGSDGEAASSPNPRMVGVYIVGIPFCSFVLDGSSIGPRR